MALYKKSKKTCIGRYRLDCCEIAFRTKFDEEKPTNEIAQQLVSPTTSFF